MPVAFEYGPDARADGALLAAREPRSGIEVGSHLGLRVRAGANVWSAAFQQAKSEGGR